MEKGMKRMMMRELQVRTSHAHHLDSFFSKFPHFFRIQKFPSMTGKLLKFISIVKAGDKL